MTVALTVPSARRATRLDLTWPILIVFAAVLCVLIVLPLSWLVYFSLSDRAGGLTLANFA